MPAFFNHSSFLFQRFFASHHHVSALKCTALTELKSNVEVLNVDATRISVAGDGVTHVFVHGPRIYDMKTLKSKIRIILKQMIKQVSFSFDIFMNLILILGV